MDSDQLRGCACRCADRGEIHPVTGFIPLTADAVRRIDGITSAEVVPVHYPAED